MIKRLAENDLQSAAVNIGSCFRDSSSTSETVTQRHYRVRKHCCFNGEWIYKAVMSLLLLRLTVLPWWMKTPPQPLSKYESQG